MNLCFFRRRGRPFFSPVTLGNASPFLWPRLFRSTFSHPPPKFRLATLSLGTVNSRGEAYRGGGTLCAFAEPLGGWNFLPFMKVVGGRGCLGFPPSCSPAFSVRVWPLLGWGRFLFCWVLKGRSTAGGGFFGCLRGGSRSPGIWGIMGPPPARRGCNLFPFPYVLFPPCNFSLLFTPRSRGRVFSSPPHLPLHGGAFLYGIRVLPFFFLSKWSLATRCLMPSIQPFFLPFGRKGLHFPSESLEEISPLSQNRLPNQGLLSFLPSLGVSLFAAPSRSSFSCKRTFFVFSPRAVMDFPGTPERPQRKFSRMFFSFPLDFLSHGPPAGRLSPFGPISPDHGTGSFDFLLIASLSWDDIGALPFRKADYPPSV